MTLPNRPIAPMVLGLIASASTAMPLEVPVDQRPSDRVADSPAPPLPRRAGPIGVAVEGAPGGGPVVTMVMPGSAAEAAGLAVGDRIGSIDGRVIAAPAEVAEALANRPVGDRILLGIERGGEEPSVAEIVLRPASESVDGCEVRYGSVTVPRGYRLRTIVTVPEQSARAIDGRLPAFMFVQGITCDTIDRPLWPDVADTRLVHAMAKEGFVTIRVDKPGIGDSEGPSCSEIGFAEELEGFAAALAALAEMPEVDPERLYLFGHSMGGVMAPYLSSLTPVRGTVVYGTLVRTWFEYQLENVRRQMELQGYGPEFVTAAVQAEAKSSSVILIEKGTIGDVWSRWPELRQPTQGVALDEEHLSTRHMRFFHELQDLNLAEAWLASTGDVLALWGEFDWVCSQEDHDRIAALVDRRSPGSGRSMVLPGADHAFTRHANITASLLMMGRGEPMQDLPETVMAWIDQIGADERESAPSP